MTTYKKIGYLFCILFLFIGLNSYAQEYNYFLNVDFTRRIMKQVNSEDSTIHTSFLPLRESYLQARLGTKIKFENDNRIENIQDRRYSKLLSKIFYKDQITIKQKDLKFALNFLFNIQKTIKKDDPKQYWQNTRGFEIHGSLGKKLSFYSDFFENQAYFLPFIDNRVNQNFVVPGQGSWKIYGKDKLGKDYNYASGYLSFSLNKNFNIQLGHSKNFIGSGYRSLLLSDNSFSYPFLKFTITKNKFQYTILYTEFQDFNTKYYFYHYKKHGSFLYLNYVPIPNIEIGFFEGIIWHTSDDSTYVKHFPAMFFIPLPFVRELYYGLNDKNNAIVGLNLRAKIYKYGDVYGQLAIDDFSNISFYQRYAFQAGIKSYDIFANKIHNQNLYLQLEYNYAKPYTYSQEDKFCAYTNMNEPLASPLGAGFKEYIGILSWEFYGFEIAGQINRIYTSQDTSGTNFGVNILKSDKISSYKNIRNFVGQGIKSEINIKKIYLAYTINTKTNLQIFISAEQRKNESNITKDNIFFVSFGLKNRIKNFYTDY